MSQCRTTLNLSQRTRILNAASFLIDDEHPQALTEYLPDYHGSVSVDILKKVSLPLKVCLSSGDLPALQSSMEFCTANMN